MELMRVSISQNSLHQIISNPLAEQQDNPGQPSQKVPVGSTGDLKKTSSKIGKSWWARGLLLLFGLSSLLPWNIYINAASLFQVRLKDTIFEESYPNFVQAVGIICNLLGSGISVYLSRVINIRKLIVLSNMVLAGPIGLQCILTKLDTSTWKETFFLLSLLVLALSAFGHSAQTSSVSAIITMTSPSLMVWFYTGKGIAGLLAVCLNLITVSFPGMDVESAAFWYFLVTFIFCFIVVTYLEYHFVCSPAIVEAVNSTRTIKSDITEIQLPRHKTLSVRELANSCKGQCLAAFLISFTSLAIFPALSTLIKEYYADPSTLWSRVYFQPVSIFLVWALGDSLGKITSGFVKAPGKTLLVVLSVVRVGLVPLLLMCNVQPRTLPVWFKSDAIAPIIIFITAVTGGHFINLNLMYSPTYVEGIQNKGRISTIMFFLLSAGMATASGAIFGFSALVNI